MKVRSFGVMKRSGVLVATAALAFSALAACGSGGGNDVKASEDDSPLVAAAKKEGEVTVYSVDDPAYNALFAEAFEKEYGIRVTFYRATAADLMARYSAEQKAGDVVADVMNVANPFFHDQNAKWFVKQTSAVNPAIESVPTEFQTDQSFVWTILLTSGAYNSDVVKEKDVPKTWEDLLSPANRDRLLLMDPRTSDNYLTVLNMLSKEVGEDFIRDLGDAKPRLQEGSVPGVQAIAAGEKAFLFPVANSFPLAIEKEGAPVKLLELEPSTGIHAHMGVSAEAPHPKAAQLFANWVLSDDAKDIISKMGHGSVSDVTDGSVKNYVAPDVTDALKNKSHLLDLLGLD